MTESAFEADERKRRQKEAEQTLHKSIGVQDGHGRQLHGHERTLATRELREELKATQPKPEAPAPKPEPPPQNLREQMKAAAAAPQKEAERKVPVRNEPQIRVAINAPHKATARGMEIALTIADPPAAAGTEAAAIVIGPWQPIPAATANKVIIEPFATLLGLDLVNSAVSGLATEWTLTEGDVIYLELDYTAGGPDQASVTLIGGAPWSGATAPFDYPVQVETSGAGTLGDPYVVEKTRYLVAYTAAADDTGTPAGCMTLMDGMTPIKVIRCVFGPLQLVYQTIGPNTFAYPDPPPRIP